MQDNIAKRSLHYVLPYGIGTNVVRIFYIWKEKGKNLQIKMKFIKKNQINVIEEPSSQKVPIGQDIEEKLERISIRGTVIH